MRGESGRVKLGVKKYKTRRKLLVQMFLFQESYIKAITTGNLSSLFSFVLLGSAVRGSRYQYPYGIKLFDRGQRGIEQDLTNQVDSRRGKLRTGSAVILGQTQSFCPGAGRRVGQGACHIAVMVFEHGADESVSNGGRSGAAKIETFLGLG